MNKHNPQPWKFLDQFRGSEFKGEWPTLSELFSITTKRFPNNICFEAFGTEHETYTYTQAKEIIQEIANKLHERGIMCGDKVGLTGKNTPQWALAYFAITFAGAIIVPVDCSLNAEEITHILSFAGIKALFADSEKLDEVKLDILKISLTKNAEPFIMDFRSAQTFQMEPVSEEDTAAIMFTSGTTGMPKGVELSHKNYVSDLFLAQGNMNISDTDVFYAILPIHHAYTMLAVFLEAIGVGAKIVFGKRLVIRQVFKEVKDGNVTMFLGVPLLFNKLLSGLMKGIKDKSCAAYILIRMAMSICGLIRSVFGINLGKHIFKNLLKNIAMDNIRICICGGGPLPHSTLKQFNQLGLDFVQGYGLTETSPIIALNPVFDYIEKSVGKIITNVKAKIVDPDENGNGTIYVKGPIVMKGYYNNHEATEEILDSEGWLNTGDIGHLDSRNYLYLTGRAKNIIVTDGGKNVFPEEIEDHFQLFYDIDQICVMGYTVDKAMKAEGVMAYIHPSDECISKYAKDSELLDYITSIVKQVNSNLISYKKIRKIAILKQAMPISSTKKIQRFKLKNIETNLRADI